MSTFINGRPPSLNVPPKSKMLENPVFKDVGLPLLQPILALRPPSQHIPPQLFPLLCTTSPILGAQLNYSFN